MVLRDTLTLRGETVKMADPALPGMGNNPRGSVQGEDLRRSSRPNLGVPPDRLGAVSFPNGLLSSTHVMAGGRRMTRTTIVAPPEAIVRRRVEDDAGSQSSAATSDVVSLYDEEIGKIEATINRKLKELTLLQQMREEKAAEDRSQQVSDVEDRDQEPVDIVNPDYMYEDPSAITGEVKGVHFVPTPRQTEMPLWKSMEMSSEPTPQPPQTSTPIAGWRQQPLKQEMTMPRKSLWRPFEVDPPPLRRTIGVDHPPQPMTRVRKDVPVVEQPSPHLRRHAEGQPPPRLSGLMGHVVGQPPPHFVQGWGPAVGQPPLQRGERVPVVEQTSPPQNQEAEVGALASAIVQALQSQNKQTERFVARQSQGSSLPSFGGNPLDWPIFAHHYRQSTEDCGFTAAQNMARLEKALLGEARRHVRALMIVPENAEAVMTRLEQRYGRPEFVVQALVEIARKTPTPSEGRLSTIVDYAGAINNLVTTIETLRIPAYLNNPQLMQELVEKLPDALKLQWGMKSVELGSSTLVHFAEWVDRVAEAASRVITPKLNFKERKEDNFHAAVEETSSSSRCCTVCQKEDHSASNCERFKGMKVDDRWKLAKDNSLCFRCLGKNHSIKECRVKWTCKAEGCTKRHHTMLHGQVPVLRGKSNNGSVEVNATVNQASGGGAILRIVAVNLHGPGGEMAVNALLDEGSTVTLVSDKVAQSLGLKGPKTHCTLGGQMDPCRRKMDPER